MVCQRSMGHQNFFFYFVGHGLWPSSADTLVSRTSFVSKPLAASLGLHTRALEWDLQKGKDLEEGGTGGC